MFLLEQLRKEGKLPPAGELATPLDHSTLFPEHESSNTTGSTPSEEATLKLSNGVSMPQLAFGLYKIPNDEDGINIILEAVEAGYRHFDAATAYGNTATLGKALRQCGIPRRDFFLATKVWNDAVSQGRDSVRRSVDKELTDLGFADSSDTFYFDLVYIHWPVPGHFIEAYRELQLMHNEGKILGIGLSNFNAEEYTQLLESSIGIPPVVSQFEVSPIMYRPKLVNFFQEKGIVVIASKALGRAAAFEAESIRQLARKYSVSPAQIMLRWAVAKGISPICKTSNSDRMRQNRSIQHFTLDDSDLALLDAMTSEEAIRERTELEATRKTSS